MKKLNNAPLPDWASKLDPRGQAQWLKWFDPNFPEQPPATIRCFLRTRKLTDPDRTALTNLGITLGIDVGGSVSTATIPVASLQALCGLDCIHSVELPKTMKPINVQITPGSDGDFSATPFCEDEPSL